MQYRREKKKSQAQIYLERVEMIDAIVENKLIEQMQWKELALNISSNMDGERVQTSVSPSKMADAVLKCVDMEKEISDYVDKLIAEKNSVVQTLEKLYSPIEYKILHMRYIQYISLTDIAAILDKDYTWVTTTHGRALKNLQYIIGE